MENISEGRKRVKVNYQIIQNYSYVVEVDENVDLEKNGDKIFNQISEVGVPSINFERQHNSELNTKPFTLELTDEENDTSWNEEYGYENLVPENSKSVLLNIMKRRSSTFWTDTVFLFLSCPLSKSVELWEKGNIKELYSYNINLEDWGYKVVKGSLMNRVNPYSCNYLFDYKELSDRGVDLFDEYRWRLSSYQTYIELFKRRKQKNKTIFFCDIEDYKKHRTLYHIQDEVKNETN